MSPIPRASASLTAGWVISQQLAIASMAPRIWLRPSCPRDPSRVVSADLGTDARLSKAATLSWWMPSAGSTGMQVGMARIVLVTRASTTLLRKGIASS